MNNKKEIINESLNNVNMPKEESTNDVLTLENETVDNEPNSGTDTTDTVSNSENEITDNVSNSETNSTNTVSNSENEIADDASNLETNSTDIVSNSENKIADDAFNLETNSTDTVSNSENKIADDASNLETNSTDAVSNSKNEMSDNSSNLKTDNVINNKKHEQTQKNIENIPIQNMSNEKKKKRWVIPLIISIVTVLLLCTFSTIFGVFNIWNTKIIYGTKISNIDVSNLTKEEAYEKISSLINEKLANPIILKHNDYETNIFAEQFEVNFDLNSAIDMAYDKGKNGNIFENNFNIIGSFFTNSNIVPNFTYNDDSILTLLTEIETNLPDKLVEPSYYVDGNNLVITKGVDGVVVLRDNLKYSIFNYINNIMTMDSTIDIPCESKTASSIDINKIHDEVYKAPQDAYYTTEPYALYPHSDGIDFSISIDEAIQTLAQDTQSYTIPLKVLSPNVTTNQIGTEAFPNLLAEYSTHYSTSNKNRSTNISLASAKINGIVIMPGEVFSYNQTVGQRTAAAGFKSAGAYSNGQVINTIGGGICQVSSTLYNAVLLSNLEIVERTNHYFDTGYVPAGRDATVSWGGPDFKFKNNRNYPIKIVCSGTGGTVNFKIYGLRSENDYEVAIESKYIQTIKYKTVEQKDDSLPRGTTKVIESGSNGCKTETYKILKQNGVVVSRTRISSDTYNPHNRIVAVGTK